MAQFKRKSAGAVYTANASFTWTISGIALVACGGGGGGGAPSSIAVSYYDITIYGGPISGAKLYSDVNNNDVANQLDGGAGADAASYEASDEAVTVDVSDDSAERGGYAAGDRLINIENLIGSDFDDTLIGDDADNILEGRSGADTLAGGEGGDVFAISHIASDIENACVITDFSMDDNDWLDFSAYIDALWYDQSRSVNTGEASNDSSQNDTVLYGKADGSEVVIVLEDFSDTDFFMAISRASIELHAFEAEIV